MSSLLDIALSELPTDFATWPEALRCMPERNVREVLVVLFDAWVHGQLETHLRALGETDRSFGALLSKLPSNLTEDLSVARGADSEHEVRRWCWAPGWTLSEQDEDLMVMRDEYITALLEEGAAGCPKRDYVFGIVEHHVRDQVHHALWDGASKLPERLAWAGRLALEAAQANASEVADYAQRVASYARPSPVKLEEVRQRVFDLRRCHANLTSPPNVNLEGDRWIARFDRANLIAGRLVVERRTGAMWAEETSRRP